MQHVGLAGAGLIGRLLAWRLLRCGYRVSIFDGDDRAGQAAAGTTAAGMLAPMSEGAEGEEQVAEMGRDSVTAWKGLLADLVADGAPTVDFRATGSLVVAHAADIGNWKCFRTRLAALGSDGWQELDQGQLLALEPELADRFPRGLHLSAEGCLDSRQLFAALEKVIHSMGGVWHCGEQVAEVHPGELRLASGARLCFDLAADCRGMGAKEQWPGLRGVRGELLLVRAQEVQLSRPVRLLHPRYQLYLVPRKEQVFVAGATEIESDACHGVTVRSGLELLSALFSLHPGFAEAEILELNTGLRPAFPDNLPKVEAAPGLLRINGLYRHGYLLAPALLERGMAALTAMSRRRHYRGERETA